MRPRELPNKAGNRQTEPEINIKIKNKQRKKETNKVRNSGNFIAKLVDLPRKSQSVWLSGVIDNRALPSEAPYPLRYGTPDGVGK